MEREKVKERREEEQEDELISFRRWPMTAIESGDVPIGLLRSRGMLIDGSRA